MLDTSSDLRKSRGLRPPRIRPRFAQNHTISSLRYPTSPHPMRLKWGFLDISDDNRTVYHMIFNFIFVRYFKRLTASCSHHQQSLHSLSTESHLKLSRCRLTRECQHAASQAPSTRALPAVAKITSAGLTATWLNPLRSLHPSPSSS